jgi:hypothetical protein
LSPFAFKNLEEYPAVEVTFETPHRIRSWSLQAVGNVLADAVFESLATVLVLQGRTLDGQWHLLDVARTANDNVNGNEVSELYTSAKKRLDRPVQNIELVEKIRIAAVAVQGQTLAYMGFVWFPQIQVFAGVPVIPKLIQDYYGGGSQDTSNIHVRSNGGTEYDDNSYTERDAGERVFDREVAGNNIARIGSRAWYINNNHFLLEDVAENGNISQFGAYQSKAWLSVIFPAARILGYLYSIDNLRNRSDNHANTSYAASLYFEGRQTADDAATLEPSGQWDFIDLVSLDRCIGHNEFGVSTSTLIAESGQTTLNSYAAALGLPVSDRTYVMNRFDRHIIRYNAGEWYDDGLRLEHGTTAATANQFNNMTTAELLAQAGQARLHAVAIARGSTMQPPWGTIPNKAAIVNQKDNKRMMYDLTSQTWSEVPNNDAIDQLQDRTHYADLKDSLGNPMLLAQLRCTAQSIMNTEKPSVGGEPVAMPEMQLFGLPANTINAGTVATITYLKAENAAGKLLDCLGKYQSLPCYSHYINWYTHIHSFRLYVGTIQNIKTSDKKLYLDVHTAFGKVSGYVSTETTIYNNPPYRDISIQASQDCRTGMFFELYIFSASNERIVLASGYTGENAGGQEERRKE